MRKLLALAIVGLMAAPAAASLDYALGIAGGVNENWNSMTPADTSLPMVYNWTSGMNETAWKIEYNNVDYTTNLYERGRWPTNGCFNTGEWGAYYPNPVDGSVGCYDDTTARGYLTVRLVNDTGADIDQIAVLFDQECWLRSDQTKVSYVKLQVSTDACATWTDLMTNTIQMTKVPDIGNRWSGGNRADRCARNLGGAYAVSVANNAEFLVRWQLRKGNYDDKRIETSIDNIRILPEPATMALLGLGLAGLLIRRK